MPTLPGCSVHTDQPPVHKAPGGVESLDGHSFS